MIYLDNAATTMRKPEAVTQAVVQALSSMGNSGRGVHGAALDASRVIYETRVRLARLFHAPDPARVVFTANATQSLNIAIKGTIGPGDHVITTALEHNSVLRPLYELQAQGARLTILPADSLGRIDYADMEAAVRPDTRAIVCTHGSNLTGNMIDLHRVGAIARAHGLLLIADASQTAGVMDVDVQAMNIGILCFTGHKGLLGPQGTGGMVVAPGVQVRPLLTGGSGVMSYSRTHPQQMPTALEAGTLNGHGIAGLGAAVQFILNTGTQAIRDHERALMRAFYEGARAIEGVRIYGDFEAQERCAIVSINVRDYDSAEVADALQAQYGVAVRPGAHCAPLMHEALGTAAQGAVRFSFSYYNTMDDVHAALAALRELAAEE
ncbi:MAG: aminotransferase class V-fold PLP-dependent enzyme [Clostridia bacterium]|nr:aminotransferase class V-fold PLP-dependent enzyme [Clostridia bacterium]